jgi:UDP:flavonoid glycosyltransferase YjiC (YdhE family)
MQRVFGVFSVGRRRNEFGCGVGEDGRVRMLFAFAGGSGHFLPLVPIARAAEAVGHEVAVVCPPGMAGRVAAEGFAALPAGVRGDDAPPVRMPLLPLDAEREDRDVRDGFAGWMASERAAAIGEHFAAWHPDVVVRDEMDFGTVVAAERAGLPHATVLVIAAGGLARAEVVGEPLRALRAQHGLPPDPELRMLSRHLVLSPFPPSYRDPRFPLPDTAHPLRPLTPAPPAGTVAPEWLARLDRRPTIYLTLGTIFNTESGDLFPRLLAGLRELDANLVVTVGQHIDPAEFGPQPDGVHIERYVPQALLLPHCDLVVSHGGSGSVMGALEHGLPMIIAPMGADQPLNAARCAALGLGRVVDAVAATPQDVRAAAAEVLADRAYRAAAERVRAEISTLPGPAHAVALLEQIG